MTKEEKQLLLIDLCGRLPYGVKVQIQNEAGYDVTFQLSGYSMGYFYINGDAFEEDELKPYLRPMSSMTEEDIQNMFNSYYFKCNSQGIMLPCRGISELLIEYYKCYMPIDWLNSHHFDYRGLIDKGLALEAPEGMYKTE